MLSVGPIFALFQIGLCISGFGLVFFSDIRNKTGIDSCALLLIGEITGLGVLFSSDTHNKTSFDSCDCKIMHCYS